MLEDLGPFVKTMDYRPERDDPTWLMLKKIEEDRIRRRAGVVESPTQLFIHSDPRLAARGFPDMPRPDFLAALGGAEPEPVEVAPPPPPADPLALQIPRAPLPVDVAAIRQEEMDALTKERGPRIKPNPKGLKGFLLALAKGGAGLAEGWSRSSGSFMDAIPAMSEAASRRIQAYRDNTEDSAPFDAELKDRMQQRIEPLLQKYGQERQIYGDKIDRYGLEKRERDDAAAQTRLDREQTQREQNAKDLNAERIRVDTRIRRRDERNFTYRMEQIRTTAATALRNTQSREAKEAASRQTKALDKQLGVLSTKEKNLYAERRQLQSHLANKYGIFGNETPAVDDPKIRAARVRLSEIEDEIEDVASDKEDIVNRYTSVAQTLISAQQAAPAPRAGRIITKAEALRMVDEAERKKQITAEQAAQKRADIEALEAGGQ